MNARVEGLGSGMRRPGVPEWVRGAGVEILFIGNVMRLSNVKCPELDGGLIL